MNDFQLAPVWAEPETHGEAYIPLDPASRERSLAIWQDAPNIELADESAPEAEEATE